MHDDDRQNGPRRRRKPTGRRVGGLGGSQRRAARAAMGGRVVGLAVLAGVVVLVAGCGGGSSPPSVASVSTTASSADSNGSSSRLLFSPGIGGLGASMSTDLGTAGVGYAACMRSHGVPNFPDPNAQGTLTITVSKSLDPSAPLFQKAEGDCEHLVPASSQQGPSPALQQRIKQRALAFAACMRSHGVPGYPDPTFTAGGVSQSTSKGDGVDPNSPTFKHAQQTCQAQRQHSAG